MEHDELKQELVKCVLVGDTAVGKTRLICARACNVRTSLRQLLATHVPTVWAIDQYRMYKEVLERSISNVDSVQVSIRIWDTFGDHDKDRKFAYGRADVILLCFSIGSRTSLLHCKSMWYSEIRRFCPDTPVILVGCKNDLRFLIHDPIYSACCRDRSPFVRPIREEDLVMPEQARAVANELGIPYYETSVYTYYGVDQVFENAIRCALIARRSQRFWMTNLKYVRPPSLQVPYCPPKKEPDPIPMCAGHFGSDIKHLLQEQEFPDIVFVIGHTEITAHRFVIAGGVPHLMKYLEIENSSDDSSERRGSLSSTASESTVDECECLLGRDKNAKEAGYFNAIFSTPSTSSVSDSGNTDPTEAEKNNLLNSVIECVRTRDATDCFGNSQIVIELRRSTISSPALKTHLDFLYTGELPKEISTQIEGLNMLAELFGTTEMTKYLKLVVTAAADGTPALPCTASYAEVVQDGMWKNCTEKLYTDVVFHLDDGNVSAHRAILMARSDVMKAMFTRDFRESRSRSVTLPGVKTGAFWHFLEYIYTDSIKSRVPIETAMLLLELANRLCLPRLINILENVVIMELAHKAVISDVGEDYIRILEPAQLHNAENLAAFCMLSIATSFDDISRNHGKLFKELGDENQERIRNNRWPPVWYVKDLDYYRKAIIERYKVESALKKGRKRSNSGCLCFSGKSRCKGKDDSRTGSSLLIDSSYTAA